MHLGGKGPETEFYSIASNKLYTIRTPGFSDNKQYGPTTGYMVAHQSGNRDDMGLQYPLNHISLLNPLNNSEVCLPDLCSSKIVVSLIGPQRFQCDDYVIVMDTSDGILVCKAGDDKWDCIGNVYSYYRAYYYMKSLLFYYEYPRTGVTKVMDINSCKEVYAIPAPKYENLSEFFDSTPYLVESCGEILRLSRSVSMPFEFDIHRLEFGNGKGDPCWVKVRSIGDQILFYDFATKNGFSLRASDLAGCKGNFIYFINDFIVIYDIDQEYRLGMYDIENGSTVFIDYPFDRENGITWFVPTLNHI